MSFPKTPEPAKLVVGVFMKDRGLFPGVGEKLAAAFGEVDLIGPWFPFDFTHYYESEMGGPLFRRFLVFKKLIRQETIVEIKLTTNTLENEYTLNGRRQVNIDPGYLLRERFVLVTGKNFAHRIYLAEGIYADLTLIFQKNRYRKLPWTYPDYGSGPIVDFLSKVRRKYVDDLKRYPTRSKTARSVVVRNEG